MKSMKEAGHDEIAAVKNRALKSFAMGRISKVDCDFFTSRCDEMDAHLVTMEERNERRDSFG